MWSTRRAAPICARMVAKRGRSWRGDRRVDSAQGAGIGVADEERELTREREQALEEVARGGDRGVALVYEGRDGAAEDLEEGGAAEVAGFGLGGAALAVELDAEGPPAGDREGDQLGEGVAQPGGAAEGEQGRDVGIDEGEAAVGGAAELGDLEGGVASLRLVAEEEAGRREEELDGARGAALVEIGELELDDAVAVVGGVAARAMLAAPRRSSGKARCTGKVGAPGGK
jgi:hypothetical protein